MLAQSSSKEGKHLVRNYLCELKYMHEYNMPTFQGDIVEVEWVNNGKNKTMCRIGRDGMVRTV